MRQRPDEPDQLNHFNLLYRLKKKYLCETARPAPFPSPVPPWVPTRARGSRQGHAGSGAGQLPRSASPGARVPSPPCKIPGNTRFVLEMPRNPPVNSCRSSAPSPELRGPPPRGGGCALMSPLAGRGWRRKEGRGRRGSTPNRLIWLPPASLCPQTPQTPLGPAMPCRPGSPAGPCPLARVRRRGTWLLLSLARHGC